MHRARDVFIASAGLLGSCTIVCSTSRGGINVITRDVVNSRADVAANNKFITHNAPASGVWRENISASWIGSAGVSLAKDIATSGFTSPSEFNYLVNVSAQANGTAAAQSSFRERFDLTVDEPVPFHLFGDFEYNAPTIYGNGFSFTSTPLPTGPRTTILARSTPGKFEMFGTLQLISTAMRS